MQDCNISKVRISSIKVNKALDPWAEEKSEEVVDNLVLAAFSNLPEYARVVFSPLRSNIFPILSVVNVDFWSLVEKYYFEH